MPLCGSGLTYRHSRGHYRAAAGERRRIGGTRSIRSGKRVTPAQSQEQGVEKILTRDWNEVQDRINGNLVYTDVILQNNLGTSALIDEGCQCYAAINGDLVKGLGLRFVSREAREVKGASSFIKSSKIEGVL